MTLVTVPMYRIVCSSEDCKASPQDDAEFFAWADTDTPLIEAQDCGWFTNDDTHLCEKHAPVCVEPECLVALRDHEWDDRCEDHAVEDPS